MEMKEKKHWMDNGAVRTFHLQSMIDYVIFFHFLFLSLSLFIPSMTIDYSDADSRLDLGFGQ